MFGIVMYLIEQKGIWNGIVWKGDKTKRRKCKKKKNDHVTQS